MKKLLLLFSLVFGFCLAGCQTAEAPRASGATNSLAIEKLAGSYYHGDGLGYNIHLTLKPDGSYDAKWHGCLGEYGAASGHWTLTETISTAAASCIEFIPAKETDMMKGHLRKLEIAAHKSHTILIPTEPGDRSFFKKYGPSPFSCFQRQEDLKQ